ncbi:DUF4406 domain-containing protein [Ruminococcaceae bacterium OttesenSCG-928-D13]|nr:DUF4406 domain-containing protein [Ruminococcaceae bacterium OttesenSCG-928-D13]
MPERPFVYVCSPFRGDVEENTRRALEYSRRVFEAGYCPLAPHLLFPRFLDDSDPAQRQAGIEMGLALLAQCRQLVVCGGDVTEGMALEIDEARRLGIGICPLDELPATKLHPASVGKTSLRKKLTRACPAGSLCRGAEPGQERDV